MKIPDHEIRMIIREELYRNSLLSEAMDVGTGVTIKGTHKVAGVVRGKKDGKKGTWYLVHWGGTMADKIPEKDHIDNPDAMDWLADGEIQKGWTMDTLKSIVNKYPAKGVFTWKQKKDLDSQAETGISSSGKRTGHIIQSEEIEAWADAGMSFFATVADLPPFAAIGGAAISASIGTAQAIKAVSKQQWLSAGLSLIALIPFIGDSWKAAYPWMKMLAKAETARKGVTLSTSGASLLAGMVSSWDQYKDGFSQLAEKVVGESDDSANAKKALTPGVMENIINAIDKEVEGFRKVVKRAKQGEKGKKVSESASLTRHQLRQIIYKTLYEGKTASKSTRISEGDVIDFPEPELPWEFGPKGYLARPELTQKMSGLEYGSDSSPEWILAIALSNRAEEMAGYTKTFDPKHFADLGNEIYQDFVIGISGDRRENLDDVTSRIDAGDYFDEEINEIIGIA